MVVLRIKLRRDDLVGTIFYFLDWLIKTNTLF